MNYDVFNGDADGICALIQLRLADPIQSTLITGIKRDIKLLDKIEANKGDNICVLDVSMKKNGIKLNHLLNKGAIIFYADHHQSGDIPTSKNLTALIDTQPNTCTSLIINQHLKGKFPLWAVTAAFGDNLKDSAIELAKQIYLSEKTQKILQKLGTYINYNGYGSCLEDLYFKPDYLYLQMKNYPNPIDFIAENKTIFNQLEQGYLDDFEKLSNLNPEYKTHRSAIYMLPNQAWAKRISGVFGNDLANQFPDRAHAILTKLSANDYQVSVRAPLTNKNKADQLCGSFPSGGGRKAAAGINHLPNEKVEEFIQKFEEIYNT